MTISTASSCAQTRYQSTINDNARVQILESIESCSGIYYLSMLAGFPAVEIQARKADACTSLPSHGEPASSSAQPTAKLAPSSPLPLAAPSRGWLTWMTGGRKIKVASSTPPAAEPVQNDQPSDGWL